MKSRFVVSAGGVILVVLGLFPVVGRLVAAIPTPVLGGAGVVLFGTVAAAGIRTLAKVKYENNMNLIIVAVSLGFGLIPVVQPTFYDAFPDWFTIIFHSGISSAALMAVVLNIVFNHIKFGNTDRSSVFVEGTELRLLKRVELEALHDGDTMVDGKLIDADGEEVPVIDDRDYDDVLRKVEAGEITSREELNESYGTADRD